jgi:hypothetical protein
MSLLLVTILFGSSNAFSVSSSSSPSHSGIRPTNGIRQGSRHHFLYVDMNMGKGEYSKETIESSQKNEWGIPDSQTLEPFSSSPQEQLSNGGRITLVGSGPGDPDLLTVKAMKLLQDPDALVICDRLVSEEIVDLVKGEVKVARKLPGCAELAQEEIYWLAHQGLAQGKHVVRLKIGDPFVFGRGGEEVLTFRRFGVESKVVPVSQSVTEKRTRKRRNDFFFSKQQILITNFFSCCRVFRRPFRLPCWQIFPSHTGGFPTKSSCAQDTVGRAPLRI